MGARLSTDDVVTLRKEMDELVGTMCKAMNDPKRLMILYALREGPLSVGNIADLLESNQANISQHLAVLRERGLVESSRQGNSIYYSLRHPKIIDAIDTLRLVMQEEISRRTELYYSI
jgi:DNA-binding transcriptional ArsR family regulator